MTTQLYAGHDLEMISKAVEVQGLWEPKIGDYIYDQYNHIGIISKLHSPYSGISVINLTENTNNINAKRNLIWLPRQDQLQAMVVNEKWGCDKWDDLFDSFYNWYYIENNGASTWTFEQNWLSYVMYKLFKKEWSGKEWEVRG